MSEPIRATKKTIQEIFDGAAAQYDRIGPRLFEHSGARLIELLGVSSGMRVLDIGTGIGTVLIPAAQRGADVVGIDVADGMLAQAEANARASGISNHRLLKMDAEHLEFPNASFDFVTCGFAIFLLPSMDVTLREIHRVMKKGGHIGVTVWGPAPFDPAWKLLSEQLRAYGVEVRMPNKVSYTEEEMSAMLQRSGFSNIQTRVETIDAVYRNEDEWWRFQFTTGARAALGQISDEARQTFRDEYLAKLRHLYRADGLHLPAPAMYVMGKK